MKKLQKITAIFTVLVMISSYLAIAGELGTVIAENIEEQLKNADSLGIVFDTAVEKEDELDIDKPEENKLWVKISAPTGGYLKSINIKANEPNFKFGEKASEIKEVQEYTENEISINQVKSGKTIELDLPIEFVKGETITSETFSKISKIDFSGIYVDKDGNEVEVAKEKEIQVRWTRIAFAKVETNLTKYVPYSVKGKQGVLVEETIKTSVEDSALPIANEYITVNVPEIANMRPYEVTVLGADTYEYDNNNKKLVIEKANPISEETGEIEWQKDADVFRVTYKYDKEAYGAVVDAINLSGSVDITAYESKRNVLNASYDRTFEITGDISNIVGYSIDSTKEVSKGYMYANLNKQENKIETTYGEVITANIGETTLTDQLAIDVKTNTFDNGMDLTEYIRTVYVNKENMQAILGEEGRIDFFVRDERVAGINSQEGLILDGNYLIDFNEFKTSEVRIVTSKPVSIGLLQVAIEKSIKTEMSIAEQWLEEAHGITTRIEGIAYSDDFAFVKDEINGNIELIEPELKADIVVDREELTTVGNNENVQIKAILKTDSLKNRLFRDPIIEINVPEFVTGMNVKTVEILYDNVLQVANFDIADHKLVIQLQGTQVDYDIDSLSGGANIVITADLTLDDLTPNKKENFEMRVLSENRIAEGLYEIAAIGPQGIITSNTLEKDGQVTENIIGQTEEVILDVDSEEKPITITGKVINNYDTNLANVKILGRIANKDLPISLRTGIATTAGEAAKVYYSSQVNAGVDLKETINGWSENYTPDAKSYLIDLSGVEMAHGDRIDFNYEATVPANLDYDQSVNENYTVYFNNNIEGNQISDITRSANVRLTTGSNVELAASITSAIEKNSTIREAQVVRFTATVKNTGRSVAKNIRAIVEYPRLPIYLYNNSEGQKAYSLDQSVGGADVGYVRFDNLYFDGSDFGTQYLPLGDRHEIDSNDVPELASLEPGKIVTFNYEMRVSEIVLTKDDMYYPKDSNNEIIYPELEFSNKITVTANDIDAPVESNNYKLKFAKGDVAMLVYASEAEENTLIKGRKFTYKIKIQNIRDEYEKKVDVTAVIPNGLEIKNVTVSPHIAGETGDEVGDSSYYTKRVTGNTVNVTINNINAAAYTSIDVETEVIANSGTVSPIVSVKVNNKNEFYSNTLVHKLANLDVNFVQSASDNLYVKECQDKEFTFNIKNNTEAFISGAIFKMKIPTEYVYKSSKIESGVNGVYGSGGGTYDPKTRELSVNFTSLLGNEEQNLKVILTAQKLPDQVKEKKVETVGVITIGEDQNTAVYSNKLTTTVEYDSVNHDKLERVQDAGVEDLNRTGNGETIGGNSNGGSNNGTNSSSGTILNTISGTAFIDKNVNGKMDGEDGTAANIPVYLYSKSSDTVVGTTSTSGTGTYQFSNIKNGEYIVVFEYDTSKFNLAEYKAMTASETTNSDVISGTFNLNGVQKQVAYTDNLVINNSNERNVNIGLVSTVVSDLRLTKEVDSITVSNETGMVRYDYDGANRQLAKRELTQTYINSTNLLVRYVITITNEGQVAEYVRKVADYPSEYMTFSSELNPSWQSAENGMLINSSLANTKLEPGSSATFQLILSMPMTEERLGILSNSAEIYESYNEEGAIDRDSRAGNKAEKEDDYGTADIVLGIRTGKEEAIGYSIIAISIIVPITASAILIRKYAIESANKM